MKYLLIIFISLSSLAVFKDINISEGEFNRYIHPQLRSMQADFLTLIRELDENNSQVITLHKQLKTISHFLVENSSVCRDFQSPECLDTMKLTMQLLRDIQKQVSDLEFKLMNVFDDLTFLKFLKQLNSVNALIEKAINDFHFDFITHNTEIHYKKNNESLFQNYAIEFRIQSNLVLITNIRSEIQQNVHSTMVHFFGPIEDYVVQKRDREYLARYLHKLNFMWNSFNNLVTKSNDRFSKQVQSISRKIHQRWTTIMKVIIN